MVGHYPATVVIRVRTPAIAFAMSHKDSIRLDIGKNSNASLAYIYGIQLTPSAKSYGTIVFTPGFGSKIDDYLDFLEPLSDSYTIIAYNLRSHGSNKMHEIPRSDGALDSSDCISDLVRICNEYATHPLVLMGHSIGAVLSLNAEHHVKADAYVLMSPFISVQYLSSMQVIVYGTLEMLQSVNLRERIDISISQKTPERLNKWYSNLDKPLKEVMALKEISISFSESYPSFKKIATPVLYFISNRDEVLGTIFNRKRFEKYNRTLSTLSQIVEQGNELVADLNHCLNPAPYNLKGFCKNEKYRDSIVHRIHNFLEEYYDKG